MNGADLTALQLSLALAAATVVLLLPLALLLGHWLATTRWRGRALAEALLLLPLLLPPTVVGLALLIGMGPGSVIGRGWQAITGGQLVFSFAGILVASVVVNLPLMVQPAQRAFEAVGDDLRGAAASCGLSPLRAFTKVELPLAWPGLATGAVLAFAHTLGEFGVVLMVGGAIPGETATLSLAIYDRVQAFDMAGAVRLALLLLGISLIAITLLFLLGRKRG
ncbi:molybdate ABC transporter permease subunit [Sandarakinorhabdus limnophila]|uniref:molybdate ABC transporter permease subunit n=1 Tax=Sandarakinorhabdus limnophila TaxID=210512 RepID=UPI0026EE2744|nr:molybdate ABC transporter permease subunit [Sandarakinorhabdus limnophila]MCM0033444.1 molybdate ABC transporter permease subunit [Sandarakinorhabdus limnophila]